MGCYIWYSEVRPGRAVAPPSPFLAIPNVTAHTSTTVADFILFDVSLSLISKGLSLQRKQSRQSIVDDEVLTLPERRTGSVAEDLSTRSLSPVTELSSTLTSLPSSSNPSAGNRSPTVRQHYSHLSFNITITISTIVVIIIHSMSIHSLATCT